MNKGIADEVATLERELARRHARVAELRAKLDAACARHAAVADLWGTEGTALPLRPLAAALVGILFANAAAFCGYVVFLSRWSEREWDVGCFAAALVSAATFGSSGRFGAGARARAGVRRVTLALLALTALELVAASARLAG
jgi:hypothetical protein